MPSMGATVETDPLKKVGKAPQTAAAV